MENLIADLAGKWFGYAVAGGALNLEIAENGTTQFNYDGDYFTGQTSLYGTQFELSSMDIDMSGQYNADSERLDGDLYDSRDPENPVNDRFTVYRVEE